MSKEILDHLRNEHLNIGGLLRILERQLNSIKDGDRPDYFLMHDATRYLTYYADHYHHPFEDLIYERLVEKRGALSAAVARIQRQHGQIAEKGSDLHESIGGIIRGSVISRENIYCNGMEYIDLYRTHMQNEEDELFEPLSVVLTPADWMVLTSEFQWRPDPINSSEVSREYQHLRTTITEEGAGEWPWKECLVNSCPVCSNTENPGI